jgi:PAS domain S-box-containing protein
MRPARSLGSLLPLAVGAVCLGITGWLWRHERLTTQRALKADFDFSVRQTASRIEERVASYEQMLRGVQGLFQAYDRVDRERFDRYVDTLLSGADFTGIQFLAFARRHAAGAGGQASAGVDLVAPATGQNLKVVGDDPYADPARRGAMQLAGDSSGLGITPRLASLIASERTTQPGFLMFLPVYVAGMRVDGVAARRAALAGWVVAGIRMNDLMSSLYGEGTPGIEVRVYDGVEVRRETLMYASSPERAEARLASLDALEYIGIAGHTWTLAVSARPEFALRSGGDAAQIIAAAGLGISLLLGLLTHQLVSGRQRASDAAIAMTSELRASEERYRRIVETADEGIWMTDAQGRTAFVNRKLASMLGYPSAQILGRAQADFLDETHPPDVQRAAAPGSPGGAGPRELRFLRKDGAPLWVSMTTTSIVDASGGPAGALAMLTDITAKKQADAARFELEAQLRASQKMEAIGTLAGGIAHDFNNILAAILGNVALTRENAALDHEVHARLEQIGQAAARARSLVQQILAFSRKQPHHLVPQPLRPVIEESVRLLRPVLPALAELELALAETPMNVSADATQLQQVVMNLCTNAWHALDGQAGRITMGLDAQSFDAAAAARLRVPAGSYAHLWVRDTGSGMDEATRSRVFEPFFTTKPVGRGTGLGLSVAHGIVATHGGTITVTSQPGEGSCFDVYLPLLADKQAAPPTSSAPPESSGSAGRHAVYIDDDPVMVAMVHALLRRWGYRVTCFEDPRDALAALRARPGEYDIVVTDYNMPGLSGLDVANELARIRPGLPIVISSGYITEDMVTAAAQAGVRSVMPKEYTLERLPGIVGSVLAGQPMAAE